MSEMIETRESYWDQFYAGRGAKMSPPSQFAAFTAQEIMDLDHVIDVGCGDGRDSLFFARQGFQVVGLDGSAAAVAAATAKADGLSNIQFVQGDITGPELAGVIKGLGDTVLCVYARFFLHAISLEEQGKFFDTLKAALKPGDVVAFEYRTEEDSALAKVADIHYRRYQSAASVADQMAQAGFEETYQIVGFGLAKYKSEDAHVARHTFVKR